MSKSTLLVLACFLLVTVTLGVDITGMYRSPLKKPVPTAVTAPQRCIARNHQSACLDVGAVMCANLRCVAQNGRVVSLGQAEDDTWCGTGKVCRGGRCVFQRTIAEPQNPGGDYTMCPEPRK